ncbi:MAG: serine/threonine protein kinase, partial [Peptococcaceae bacterium]|nr:serine/threonine protein kinase [Peptococcaceae bacterium]
GTCPECGHSKGGPPEELYYLSPGTLLNGRFSVGQVIGSGGFGIIYKAWDQQEGCLVAIKEFFPSGLVTRLPGMSEVKLLDVNNSAEYSEGMQRFFDEAIHISKFQAHSHIVMISHWFPENNTVYYVMEYLPGPSLSSYMKSKEDLNEKMGVEEGLQIIFDVCSAVKAIHNAGILHRDISPDNIIIPPGYPNLPEGSVKLIDFGAARFTPHEKETLFTRIMKPGYSPPEQYEPDLEHNEQIDIYALGATLYHMLTGLVPEEGTNRKIDIIQGTDKMGKPLILNPAITENLSNTIMKAMAVDLRLRFHTVEDFERALTNNTKAIDPEVDILQRRKKRKKRLLIASVCIAFGLAVLGFNFALLIDKGNLPDAFVEIWYPLSGEAFADAAKTTALSAIAGEFMEIYPNVTISINGIEQGRYSDEVLSALRSARSPVVLETTPLDIDMVDKLLDLKGVLGNQNPLANLLDIGGIMRMEDCFFMDRYARYFPEQKQIPMGFNASAIYTNPELSSYDRSGIGDLNDVLASMPFDVAEKGLALRESIPGSFRMAFSGQYTLTDSDAFFTSQAGVYFADTSEFYLVQKMMPARYRLHYIDSDAIPAVFTNLWGILPCSGTDRKAAERLLQYMLGANAQDQLHIRNQSGSLPMNIHASEIFREVYSEYDTFFVNINRYSFYIDGSFR